MAVVIMSRTIRGRLYFVAGPIAFLSLASALAALADLQADLAGVMRERRFDRTRQGAGARPTGSRLSMQSIASAAPGSLVSGSINFTAWAYYRNLGKRITQLRNEREMTQAELARMLGVSQQSVFSYELGDRRVRLEFVPALTKIFGVSCDELLGIKPTPPPPRRRMSHRLARHLEILQQLGDADQRFILRLAESMLASHR